MTAEPMTSQRFRHSRPRRRRRTGRIVIWSVAGVIVILAVCAGLFVWDALTARTALSDAMDKVGPAQQALDDGDIGKATAVLEGAAPLTKKAHSHTDGPLWALAAHLPAVGQDVEAVSVAAAAADDLVGGVVPSLASASDAVLGDDMRISGGSIDLAPLAKAAPTLREAAATVEKVDDDLAAINVANLRPEVAGPFEKLVDGTKTLRSTTLTADRVASLAPDMLGQNGTRRYLVIAMNNAELRSGGGIPGAFAVISADNGKVTLEKQASTSDFDPLEKPITTLPNGVKELYSDRPGRYIQDTTMIPDFPLAAQLTSAIWTKSGQQKIDGVVATDPVALSYLLEATGPVNVAGINIDAQNAVKTLLSDAYARMPYEQTDTFFAAVASQVLTKTLGGGADSPSILSALDKAASEHRLLLWSSRSAEQSKLQDTVLSGNIDAAPRAKDSVGIFLNDATGGKMDYYLAGEPQLSGSRCTPTGRVDSYTMALTSKAPADAAKSLPWPVTGGNISGVKPGLIRTQVALYPARGGSIANLRLNGAPTAARTATVAGRDPLALPVTLAPGATATITFDAATPIKTLRAASTSHGEHPQVDLWSTPTTTSGGLRTFDVAPCS